MKLTIVISLKFSVFPGLSLTAITNSYSPKYVLDLLVPNEGGLEIFKNVKYISVAISVANSSTSKVPLHDLNPGY